MDKDNPATGPTPLRPAAKLGYGLPPKAKVGVAHQHLPVAVEVAAIGEIHTTTQVPKKPALRQQQLQLASEKGTPLTTAPSLVVEAAEAAAELDLNSLLVPERKPLRQEGDRLPQQAIPVVLVVVLTPQHTRGQKMRECSILAPLVVLQGGELEEEVHLGVDIATAETAVTILMIAEDKGQEDLPVEDMAVTVVVGDEETCLHLGLALHLAADAQMEKQKKQVVELKLKKRPAPLKTGKRI